MRTNQCNGMHQPKPFFQQNELHTRLSRAYNYFPVMLEDPEELSDCFYLFWNIWQKWGTLDNDIAKLDKTGFIMGMICYQLVFSRTDRCGESWSNLSSYPESVITIASIRCSEFAVPQFLLSKADITLPVGTLRAVCRMIALLA